MRAACVFTASVVATILVAIILLASPAFADGAYRWEDPAGRQHFGSNPPPHARNLRPLEGRTFSRYSTEKLLKGFQTTVKEEEKVEQKMRASLKHEPPSLPDPPPATAELEKRDLVVKYDARHQVTSCSISVENTGTKPADNIIVTFEFADGTLVPGSGPDALAPGAEARYAVAEELLPITMEPGNSPSADPEVTVQAVVD